jgi:hypothetical protein
MVLRHGPIFGNLSAVRNDPVLFIQVVAEAHRAEQPHRQDVAWIFVGFLFLVLIIAMAALSSWIWRGGLSRDYGRANWK